MRRREFTTLLCSGAVLACSRTAGGQQLTKVARVGVLSDQSASQTALDFKSLWQALHELGYVEGHTVVLEERSTYGRNELLADLAAELVGLKVDVILALGTQAAKAAKKATKDIPIVFARTADPVQWGLVDSLARPGGNLTGFSVFQLDLSGKRLELLTQVVPGITRVGVLWDPDFPVSQPELDAIEKAARQMGLESKSVAAPRAEELQAAFAALATHQPSALILAASISFTERRQQIADLAIKARLPAIAFRKEYPEAGLLMSYGASYADMFRRVASYVDKILKGANPADLPVQQPTTFQLVINLKTAKALDLKVPLTLQMAADEVIE